MIGVGGQKEKVLKRHAVKAITCKVLLCFHFTYYACKPETEIPSVVFDPPPKNSKPFK